MNVLQGTYDVRDEIAKHLEARGIQRKWLASKVNVSPSHLSFILKKDRKLTDELLNAMNSALQTQFTKDPPDSTSHNMRAAG
jgi:ribosome-binding protein aMBF1 (putative translation factor)